MSDYPKHTNALFQTIQELRSPQRLEQQARDLFSQLVSILGQVEAARLWMSIPERKRGRPKNSKAKFTDELMFIFMRVQAWKQNQGLTPGAVARRVGEDLNAEFRGEYGASAESIRKKILSELKQRREAAALAARSMQSSTALAPYKSNVFVPNDLSVAALSPARNALSMAPLPPAREEN